MSEALLPISSSNSEDEHDYPLPERTETSIIHLIEGLSFSFTFLRQLLRNPKEQNLMIIRCHHLREVGMLTTCCSHCHVLAGCVVHTLPNDHEAVFCCGRIAHFTPEEVETLLARIPQWEAQEKSQSLQSETPVLPDRFHPAYQAIQRLEGHERYRAAFIVGSVVQGEAIEQSNLEVLVIVNEDASCRNINHPIIGGVQLNLTFLSLEQFEERTKKEIEDRARMRTLTIAESIIIFDKKGIVRHMREEARQLQPDKLSSWQQQGIQSLVLHRTEMIACRLEEDPLTSLLLMHTDVIHLLLAHYKQHQRWWVGSHRLLADLSTWDLEMARLVENFVTASEVHTKFQCWSAILDHVLQPLGGRQLLPARNCPCSRCQKDVALLLEEERRPHRERGMK